MISSRREAILTGRQEVNVLGLDEARPLHLGQRLLAICEGSDPYDDPESSLGERK